MKKGVKILIAYFSHSGNTGIAAKKIQKEIGGDIFKIETVKVYPQNYDAVVDIAQKEQNANARPELKAVTLDMDAYDTIILGYPNWWGTMPMAVFTFLEAYDFTGKTIIPFCTNEGSRMGRSIEDIKKLCGKSTILDGLAIRGSSVETAQDDVSEWLHRIGITE